MQIHRPDESDFSRQWDIAKQQTILFVDIVESVRLMADHEQATLRRLQALLARIDAEVIAPVTTGGGAGRLVKSVGDGVMLVFDRVHDAIGAALKVQALGAQANVDVEPDERLMLRIGCHTAPVVDAGFDVFGHGVNLAQRLATLAGPGETIVSVQVRDEITADLDAEIEDMGECFVKHLVQPMRAFRLSPPGARFAAPRRMPVPADSSEMRPTVAVIPFSVLEADSLGGRAQVIGDILADDVIAALSRTSDLRVISRLSTGSLRDHQGESLVAALQRLNADYVLSGHCRVAAGRIILNITLSETRTHTVVLPVRATGELAALLAGTDGAASEAAAAVCNQIIQREISRAEGSALPTLESHTLLLGSISLLHRNSADALRSAGERLTHLIDRHQRHPLPYAWLAKCHVLEAAQGWSTDRGRASMQALDTARRALDADSQCAFALALKGQVHAYLFKQMDQARADYDEALRLNPNESLAWLYKATWHAWNDEGGAAVAAAEHALSLSPLDPIKYYFDSLAATAHLVAGHFDQTIELARRSIKANATHTSTYRMLAIAQVSVGQVEEARQTVLRLRLLEPNLTVSSFLSRYPGSDSKHASWFAEALKVAGLPVN